jgi:hypothetical protein
MSMKPIRKPENTNDISSNDEGVGFGRPPKSTQFKKGQSGNPKGRPKKLPSRSPDEGDAANSLDEALKRLLVEKVSVTHQGKQKKLGKLDAVLKSLESQIFKGKPYAAKLYLDYARELEQKTTAAYVEDSNFRDHMNAAREKYLAHCREHDMPLEGFWLQDEDIIVRHGQPLRIRGPISEEDVPFYERLKWQRNLLILEQVCRAVFCEPKIGLPTADFLPILIFGWHLSTQQLLESNAYAEMVWDNAIYGRRWLEKERSHLWAWLLGSAPEGFHDWPELSPQQLTAVGFSKEQIARMRGS